MTLTISLSPEIETNLRARAAATGKDVTTLVTEAIEARFRTLPTFDEVCAPFRQAVEASGITDKELDTLFQQARDEVWREKQGRPGCSVAILESTSR